MLLLLLVLLSVAMGSWALVPGADGNCHDDAEEKARLG